MSELLTAEDVAEIVATSSDARLVSYEIRKREKHGYLGEHLTLVTEIQIDGRRCRRSYFIKTYRVPKDKQLDFIGETGMFQKEVDLYSKVLGRFREVSGLGEWCPRYYFSKHRVLVLEDLSTTGFEMKSQGKFFDKIHLELALKAIATLHASTIIFERKEKIHLDQKHPSCFKEFLYDEHNPASPTYMWKTRQVLDLTAAIDYLDKYTADQKQKAKARFGDVVDKIYPLSKKSERWPNVLVHGDMWNNNILFRYEDNVPVDCRIVDFQFSRYAPPMHDVMHLLHFNTSEEFRKSNEDEVLELYYRMLSENLARCGVNLEEFYGRDSFLESRGDYKLLAIIQSLLSVHYLLGGRKIQEAPEVTKLDRKSADEYLMGIRGEKIGRLFDDPVYAEDVGNILRELIDGYILNDDV